MDNLRKRDENNSKQKEESVLICKIWDYNACDRKWFNYKLEKKLKHTKNILQRIKSVYVPRLRGPCKYFEVLWEEQNFDEKSDKKNNKVQDGQKEYSHHPLDS